MFTSYTLLQYTLARSTSPQCPSRGVLFGGTLLSYALEDVISQIILSQGISYQGMLRCLCVRIEARLARRVRVAFGGGSAGVA